LPDTINVNISYLRTDSLDQLSPFSTNFRLQPARKEPPKRNQKDEEEEIPTLKPNIRYSIESIMRRGVNIAFPALLTHVDTSKIQLMRIDARDRNSKINEPFTLTQDTLRIRQYHLQAKWQTATDYELLILPGAFSDIYELSTDTITHTITTGDPDKFSSMKLVVSGIADDEQVILQLLDDKKNSVLREEILNTNAEVLFDYLRPGRYTIRLIRDDNKNGIWDPGIFLERRQPELVEFYTLPDGKEVIEVMENADIVQQIDAAAVFARNRRSEVPETVHDSEQNSLLPKIVHELDSYEEENFPTDNTDEHR